MSTVVHDTSEDDLLPLSHGGNTGSNPVGDANYVFVRVINILDGYGPCCLYRLDVYFFV